MNTPKIRVLVVDDEPDYAGTLALALRASGYEAAAVTDAKAALARLADTTIDPPDLLITDIVMPGMSGEELVSSVRRTSPDLPILAMTAYGDKHLVVRLMRAGCNDYIEKPFTTDEIEKHMGVLLTHPSLPGVDNTDPETQERLANIGRNLAGFVHDLNNQLAAMSGFRDLIEDGLADPRRLEYCKALKKSIFRLSAMANGVMAAAGSGMASLAVMEQVEIREMLEGMLPLANLRTKVDLTLHTECSVWAHRPRLEMVFWNLLKNADDALIGRRDGVVKVSCRRDGNDAVIAVADNGPGISDAVKGKLFQMGQTFGKKRGNGLGLYSSHRAVESMGGSLRLESSPGSGATFLIRLPMCANSPLTHTQDHDRLDTGRNEI